MEEANRIQGLRLITKHILVPSTNRRSRKRDCIVIAASLSCCCWLLPQPSLIAEYVGGPVSRDQAALFSLILNLLMTRSVSEVDLPIILDGWICQINNTPRAPHHCSANTNLMFIWYLRRLTTGQETPWCQTNRISAKLSTSLCCALVPSVYGVCCRAVCWVTLGYPGWEIRELK